MPRTGPLEQSLCSLGCAVNVCFTTEVSNSKMWLADTAVSAGVKWQNEQNGTGVCVSGVNPTVPIITRSCK